jgi:hypothetical protein
MPHLVLGPLLRHVDATRATVWVETDRPCEVTVLDTSTPTFTVGGHHYALAVVEGLPPASVTEYDVELDGERVWPEPGDRPSVIRTLDPDRPFRLAFGSCRVSRPADDPQSGVDALHALAARMEVQPTGAWPDLLLMVGDQVYADENVPEEVRAFARARRDTSRPPHEQVADFEEYCKLYQVAWGPREIRWLLSVLPTVMIFDDHDVHDDWNTSAAWREMMAGTDWWAERIQSALMSYWIYQHLGNLSPDDLATLDLLREIRDDTATGGDGYRRLKEFAYDADCRPDGTRWSYTRGLGTSRLVVIDSRAGRVLDGERREMLDPDEWAWLDRQLTGDVDHLLLATSLPYLLPAGVHLLENWNEAVCGGAWGRLGARLGEKIRQAADLEHWAAFRSSFDRLAELICAVGAGERGRPPASIVFLSGDVHFAYLAEAWMSRPVESRVFQAVCSPLRNPLPKVIRQGQRVATSRVAYRIGRALARSAGVPPPPFGWRTTAGPAFDNEVATVELAGRTARLSVDRAVPPGRLELAFAAELA